MSIVQISKIQVRSGNLEDLPQLSVGEFGWATDTKSLFIGNDPNTIGPIPDNTEVLTTLSPNVVTGASGNTGEIQFNENGEFAASSNLTWDGNTLDVIGNISAVESTITGNSVVVGNISTSGILTNNYYYANGAPFDFEQPAGANTQIQFNNNNNFGASSGLTFNSDTNDLRVTGNALIGNIRTQYILGTTDGSNLVITATGTDSSVTVVPTGLGSLDVSFKRITSLAAPITDSDAATKLYVDEVAQGLKVKQSVLCGTTTALPAYTYNNGASGVGATITASLPGALVLDGITPIAGSRVLIKDESAANAPYNGIYDVTITGTVGTSFVLTRTLDFDGDNSTAGEVDGAFTFVQSGTTLADTGWVCTANNPVVIGTTDLNFSQFSGAGTYLAGAGLTLTGEVFSVNVDNDTTEITPQGNVVVKPGANFVTPNIGNAVGNSLTLTGNTATGAILTDNYLYANGTPVDFEQPAGANTQVQFNNQNNFGASSNFTFNTASNLLTVGGNITTGNISGTTGTFSSVVGSGARLSALNASNISTGTLSQARLANSSLTVNGTILTLGGTSTITANAETLTGTTLNSTIVDSSLTSVGTLGSLSVEGNIAGNLDMTIAGNITVGGNINLTGNVNEITGNTGVFYGEVPTGFKALYAGVATGFANLDQTVIQGSGDFNGFIQINYQNINAGQQASTDFVATADNGNNDSYYINMGITSSTWDGSEPNSFGNAVSQNDGYLYTQDGNMVIGTPSAGKVTKIVSGGSGTDYQVATFNTGGTESTSSSTGAMVLLGGLGVAGNIFASNVYATNNLSVTGNITSGNVSGTTGAFTNVSGSGAALTSLNASNISSGTLAQARLANTAVTLGSTALTLGSTVTTVAGLTSVTSTAFVGALTGAATSATTAGTVTTAAQPNITSTGTLTSLAVTGNITSGNVSGTTGAFTNVSGNGSALTALNASNITTGTLDQARLANASLTVNGTSITLGSSGTVTANAQTLTGTSLNATVTGSSLTSVGTLGSLAVTGTTTVGTVQTATLTTGASGTAGSITGNWTLTAGSRLEATYADLAERYRSDRPYEPGTIMMIGGSTEVTIADSSGKYRLAGIVSTAPAYVLNSTIDNSVIVALTGRVPCLVVGKIAKGDLITISDIPGVGTSIAPPASGVIVGRALESYDSEQVGVIEVKVDQC